MQFPHASSEVLPFGGAILTYSEQMLSITRIVENLRKIEKATQ